MGNHSAPPLLTRAESAFCSDLRARNKEHQDYPRGVALYRKIIRENIISVLNSVFPLFSQRINQTDQISLIDDFIFKHAATNPEFHQIATELLVFIRQQTRFSAHDIALIEYEWLTYSVEIDESHVIAPGKITLVRELLDDISVIINPTLKIILLPFTLQEGEPLYSTDEQSHYYALYRQINHSLFQKKLGPSEAELLLLISHHALTVKSLMKEAAALILEDSLIQWLESNNDDGLLTLVKR